MLHRKTWRLSTVSTVLVSLICWALGCSLSSSDHVFGHVMVSKCCGCSAVTRKMSTSGKHEKDVLELYASAQLLPSCMEEINMSLV